MQSGRGTDAMQVNTPALPVIIMYRRNVLPNHRCSDDKDHREHEHRDYGHF